MLESLEDKRLIFITGKGGVGKSTVTASLGLALARRGKRVLVVETDTYSAMADLFGVELQQSSEIKRHPRIDGLELTNLQAEDALIEAIQQFVPSERIARTVTKNRVAKLFFKAAPSVNEFSVLNAVRMYLDRADGAKPYYDHVLVDLPASGHAVTFLNVPATLHGMIHIGKLAQINLELSERICDPERTGLVAVCLPEEMPVNETLELAESFTQELGHGFTLTMLNMVHDEPFDEQRRELFNSLRAAVPDPGPVKTQEASPVTRLIHGNALALDWYDRDTHYVDLLKERMGAASVLELPMFYEQNGGLVVDRLAEFFNSTPQGGDDQLAS